MRVEVASERGSVRDRNEDAVLVDADLGLFVVADGVGGGPAGDVASRTAVEAVHACLSGGCDGFGDVAQALLVAHRALRRRGTVEPQLAGMATTAVVAWVDVRAGTLTVGHVGDSRAYLRTAAGLRRLTDDHGVGSMLTQALGQGNPPRPEVVEVPLHGAELLLLCTDGITDVLDDETLERHVVGPDVSRVRDRLVDAAYTHGSRDNITLVAVDLVAATADAHNERG